MFHILTTLSSKYEILLQYVEIKLNYRVRVMVLNATFNNISIISWRSVLLVEETGVLGENHRPAESHWQTLSHNVVSSTPRHQRGSNSQWQWWYALIAQTCSWKSNYHTITTAPYYPFCIFNFFFQKYIGQYKYMYIQHRLQNMKFCFKMLKLN